MTPRLRSLTSYATAALASAVVAACGGDAPAPTETLPFGTIQGRLVAPGVEVFSDVIARVRWGEGNFTARVAPDGLFEVVIPGAVSGFGTLTVEPADAEPVHPSWVLLSPGDVNGGRGTVVLAPRTWTPTAGDYAGTEIPIDPELAADTRVMPSYWGFYFPFSQMGFLQTVTDNTQWAGEFRGWPDAAFPIPVALDRPGSDRDFSAADSVTLWGHIDRMEAALGRDAFRPVPVSAVQILPGTRRAAGAILVRFDEDQASEGRGVISRPEPQTWGLSADATGWSGGRVSRIQMVSADIAHAIVSLRSPEALADRQLVIHELMHTLGAGHGCSWASVQTYCASLVTDVPSPGDVAHLEALRAMRALELEHRTRWGVLGSVIGHRVVTLGLDPVPALNLLYGPASAGSGG